MMKMTSRTIASLILASGIFFATMNLSYSEEQEIIEDNKTGEKNNSTFYNNDISEYNAEIETENKKDTEMDTNMDNWDIDNIDCSNPKSDREVLICLNKADDIAIESKIFRELENESMNTTTVRSTTELKKETRKTSTTERPKPITIFATTVTNVLATEITETEGEVTVTYAKKDRSQIGIIIILIIFLCLVTTILIYYAFMYWNRYNRLSNEERTSLIEIGNQGWARRTRSNEYRDEEEFRI